MQFEINIFEVKISKYAPRTVVLIPAFMEKMSRDYILTMSSTHFDVFDWSTDNYQFFF